MILALVLLLVQTPDVALFERDPESWEGHAQGETLQITGATIFTLRQGNLQRFNPSVYAGRALSNVGVWVTFSSLITVEKGAWTDQGRNTYSMRLGAINPGERINAPTALHLTAKAPGRFVVRVIITARELAFPKYIFFILKVE